MVTHWLYKYRPVAREFKGAPLDSGKCESGCLTYNPRPRATLGSGTYTSACVYSPEVARWRLFNSDHKELSCYTAPYRARVLSISRRWWFNNQTIIPHQKPVFLCPVN